MCDVAVALFSFTGTAEKSDHSIREVAATFRSDFLFG